jgi:hypothetical protein
MTGGFTDVPRTATSVSVDRDTHTITFSANLGFWGIDPNPTNKLLVARAISRIKERWDGLRYGCYTTKVDIHCETYRTLDEVPIDFVDIQAVLAMIDDSRVVGDPNVPGDHPMSDDPEYRVRAIRMNRPGKGAMWSIYDPDAPAHEFGHLLGLNDGYHQQGKKSAPIPCHTMDLMVSAQPYAHVSMEMITRILRRNGISADRLPCPIHYHVGDVQMNAFLVQIRNLVIDADCASWQPPTDDDSRAPAPMTFIGTIDFDIGYLAGAELADARAFIQGVTGVDTSPLANLYHVHDSVQFELPPASCFEGVRVTTQPYTIDLPGRGLTFTGFFHWSTERGTPVDDGPLLLNGIPLASLLTSPGPQVTFSLGTPP